MSISIASLYEGAISNLALRQALRKHQFELHYQPIVQLATNRVVGAEALVRWKKSESELAFPADFLPQLRQLGLMHKLDLWVLEEAIRMRKRSIGLEERMNLDEFHVFVNIDGSRLQSQDYANSVIDLLTKYALDPSMLVIEISEYGFYETTTTAENLGQLRNFGVLVGLDDFGTGHSNLSQIRKLPLNVVKLDRSFISNIVKDDSEQELLINIQHISQIFGLHLLVEGVESVEIRDFITSIGIHCAQGFFYSPAVPEDELWHWIENYMGL